MRPGGPKSLPSSSSTTERTCSRRGGTTGNSSGTRPAGLKWRCWMAIAPGARRWRSLRTANPWPRRGQDRPLGLPAGAVKPVAAKGKLLDFTPDGKGLLTVQGTSVILWDWPASTQRVAVAVDGDLCSAAISTDGKTAIIAREARTAAIIDLATGK